MKRFSGQDEPLTDFPVGFDFPVEKPVENDFRSEMKTIFRS